MQVCQFSASSSLMFLRRRILYIFFENVPFMSPRLPIKLCDLDKSCMQHGGLLNYAIWTKVVCNMEDYSINISVKKKSNISSETAETVNF